MAAELETDLDSLCVICCSECTDGGIDCRSYRVNPSGDDVRTKIQQWRRQNGRFEFLALNQPGVVSICHPCLDLVEDIARSESDMKNKLDTLWRVMEATDDLDRGKVEVRDDRRGPADLALRELNLDPSKMTDAELGARIRPLFKSGGSQSELSAVGNGDGMVCNIDPLQYFDGNDEADDFPSVKLEGSAFSLEGDIAVKSERLEDAENEDLPVDESVHRRRRSKRKIERFVPGENSSKKKRGRKPKYARADEEEKKVPEPEPEVKIEVKEREKRKPRIKKEPEIDEQESDEEDVEGGDAADSGEEDTFEEHEIFCETRRFLVLGAKSWLRKDCHACGFVCDHYFNMIDHCKSAHSGTVLPYQCHWCFASFDNMKKFFVHVLNEELALGRNSFFKCRICHRDQKCKEQLDMHFKASHGEEHQYSCEDCGDLGLKDFAEFVDHRRKAIPSHMTRNIDHPCKLCSEFVGGDEFQLWSHMKDVHKDRGPYKCMKCETKYRSFKKLVRHVSFHEFSATRRCLHCGDRFTSIQDLVSHIKDDHSSDYSIICEVCNKGNYPADRFNSFQAHIFEHFYSNKSLCPICGKAVHRTYVAKHIALFHGREQRYKCTFCPRAFHVSGSRKLHMLHAHNIGETHQCSVCGKIFTQKMGLKKHNFAVHGIRPEGMRIHNCPQCGKECATSCHLARHIASVHTEDKPHRCPHCEHKTALFCNLKTHIKQVHKRVVKRVLLTPGSELDYIIVDSNVSEDDAKKMAGRF